MSVACSACICWLPWKLYDCHVLKMYWARRREISIMDALQAALQVKTLDQLAELEERVSRDVEHHSQIEESLKKVEDLRARVQALMKRKTELQLQLRHMPTDSLGAKILKDVIVEDISAASLPVEVQREIVAKAAKQEQKRKLEYILVAHRCAGITASIVQKGRVRVRFETSYKGEYFEPFYLELQFIGKRIKSVWHTIPVFVPLTNLLEEYNKNELHFTTVLYLIHAYLTAYVQRRQQTVEFTSKYSEYLSEEIASFHAYNFIQLVLGVPVEGSTSQLFLHLHYKDLQSDLPSKVRCSNPEGLPVDRIRIKQAFLSLPIAEAFQHLFLDQNIEQG